MDKYFDTSYDPRLRRRTPGRAEHSRRTGLINNAEFEGWDAMLELIKQQRQRGQGRDRKRLECWFGWWRRACEGEEG